MRKMAISIAWIAALLVSAGAAVAQSETQPPASGAKDVPPTQTSTASQESAPENPAQTRFDAAKRVYETIFKLRAFGEDRWNVEEMYQWSRRWMEAERDLATTASQRTAVAEAHLDRMLRISKAAVLRARMGESGIDVIATEFYVAEARVWLAAARSR